MILSEFLHDVVTISKSDAAKKKAYRIASRNTKEAYEKRLKVVERVYTTVFVVGVVTVVAGFIGALIFAPVFWWIPVVWAVLCAAFVFGSIVFCDWYEEKYVNGKTLQEILDDYEP